jgi:hypothetical protein
MQTFTNSAIPVRMCLAKGTCHAERFSIESFPMFNLTRSMFYGSGVVAATEGEKQSGRGCRIFLHKTLTEEDVTAIQQRFKTLPLDPPNAHSQAELNYLFEPLGGKNSENADIRMWSALAKLRVELNEPIAADVLEQYDQSFAAFNRMRVQYGRDQIEPPSAETIAKVRDKLGL